LARGEETRKLVQLGKGSEKGERWRGGYVAERKLLGKKEHFGPEINAGFRRGKKKKRLGI